MRRSSSHNPPRPASRYRAALRIAICVSIIAWSVVRARAADRPLLMPGDDTPPAVQQLGPLEGMTALTVDTSGERAAGAFPRPGKRNRSVVRLALGLDGNPMELEIPGRVRSLRFGPTPMTLFAVTYRGQRKGPGEASLLRIRTDVLKVATEMLLPSSARYLDLQASPPALVVACKNELRAFLLPGMTSGPLFRVLGDNLSVAWLPGGSRFLVGQPDRIGLVDLSDPQGDSGLQAREWVPTASPVVALAASPDGEHGLVLLGDGTTSFVDLEPLRLREAGRARMIGWLGEPREAVPHPVPRTGTPEATLDHASVPPPSPLPPSRPQLATRAPSTSLPPQSAELPQSVPNAVEIPPVIAGAMNEKPLPRETDPLRAGRSVVGIAVVGVHGNLTGPAAGKVAAVVLFGPDNILLEAERVRPERDGAWSAGELRSGTYRIVLDGGGGRVLLSDPAFATVKVAPGAPSPPVDFRVDQVW